MIRAPVIVSFGGGVDSTALLVEMVRLGDPIDRVLFADTGGEKPETYKHVAFMSEWLVARDAPPVETVRYRPVRAPYDTLEGNCLSNQTLPSLSFGSRGCSAKFKHEVMDKHVDGVRRGPNKAPPLPEVAAARAADVKPVRVIGYDAGEVAKGRGKDKRHGSLIASDGRYAYRYPLVEWGWNRTRCIEAIVDAEIPVPLKSACFFCPASKPWELYWLAGAHPDLFLRAIEIEEVARAGKHGIEKVRGLGGYGSVAELMNWKSWAECRGILKDGRVVADREELLAIASWMKVDSEYGDGLSRTMCYRPASGN